MSMLSKYQSNISYDAFIKRFKGDVAGGLTAGLIPLPKAMALGALIFAPLGPEYIAMGLAAGLISLAISNIVGALYTGLPIMNSVPDSLSSFMLLAALELALFNPPAGLSASLIPAFAITALFFTVFMSGFFQIILGLTKAGNIAKYIPYPVLAGLLNGSAVMIIFSQMGAIMGYPDKVPWFEFTSHFELFQPLTLIIAIIVCCSVRFGPSISTKVPAPLYGIGAGVVAYYCLTLFGFNNQLGSVIGAIPATLPTPHLADDFINFVVNNKDWQLLADLSYLALGIAAINSLRTLLVCSAAEGLTLEQSKSNRELVGQGMSNMATALFAGISTTGSMPSVQANHTYGGRTAWSRTIAGIFTLAVLILLHPLMALVPAVVLAGMLIMIGIESFDKWSISQLTNILSARKRGDNGPLVNTLVTVSVTSFLVFLGIVEALAFGIFISLVLFLSRMSRSPIRREFLGHEVSSNTQRAHIESSCLDRHGAEIRGIELQGALFFGTAYQTSLRAENLIDIGVKTIVLDFKHVIDIDCTGAKVIHQLIQKAKNKKVNLLLSAININSLVHQELLNLMQATEIEEQIYPNINGALTAAEDALLDQLIGTNRYHQQLPLSQIQALSDITEKELAKVSHHFKKMVFNSEQYVVRQGDEGDSVFYISSGRADIVLQHENTDLHLGKLCPGTAFGEMSLLDKKNRSTDIRAEGILELYNISQQSLQTILQTEPNIAFKILTGLGKELATRVRMKNQLS